MCYFLNEYLFAFTGRNRFLNGQEMAATQAAFGSWPRQLNGSLKYQRVVQQARTMSEPIMVVDSENRKSITPAESSSSGPEPPKRIPLTLQRKVAPLETSPSDVCVIFVLGNNYFVSMLKFLNQCFRTVDPYINGESVLVF